MQQTSASTCHPTLRRRIVSSCCHSSPNLYADRTLPSFSVVEAEAVAVAYCFNPYNDTRPFPDGFITTAHFVCHLPNRLAPVSPLTDSALPSAQHE